jgi:hypothetical protein
MRCDVQHLLEAGVIECMDWLDTMDQNIKNIKEMKLMHLIGLDKPFKGSSLQHPVTVWDMSFTSSKVAPTCCLLGLVANIHSLLMLLGVSH